MSDRPQTQPSRDQGIESSSSGDGRRFLDPRSPHNAGQPLTGASGQAPTGSGPRTLDFGTGEFLESLRLPSEHPLHKLKDKIIPGGRQQHTLGSGTQAMPAEILGDNDLVGQGLSNVSDVKQGKQKDPQESQDVGASTAKPSAGASDKRKIPSKDDLTRLYKRAMRAEPSTRSKHYWPDEHTDFFEAYVALFQNSDTTVRYGTLQDDYAGFLDHHLMRQFSNRLSSIRNGITPVYNRWQSLSLDEDGREI